VGPGELHVLPPGRRHRIRTEQGHAQFGVNFSRRADERGLLEALLRAYPEPGVWQEPFRQSWRSELTALLPGPAGLLRAVHALDDYALVLLERRRAPGVGAAPAELWAHLNAHLDEPLRVEAMARRLHLSRATLQRLCQRHFGCGAAHLHERLRLERAARQLLQADGPVAECARACGYPDLYHFSRAFKRVFGRPPSAYRRQRRGELG
jgi:AraC-like DNA-binding protein